MKNFLKIFARQNAAHSNKVQSNSSAGVSKRDEKEEVPFDGFEEGKVNSGVVEYLSNEDLVRLNNILPWMCFTVDSRGRRFGNTAWKGKRNIAQVIPDERILKLDEIIKLSDKSVLEVGCFEGVHTIALCERAKEVFAIDSRIENVVKTLVRCNLFGHKPTVSVCDIERIEDLSRLSKVDIVHHVGVLYHLKDPISHLYNLKGVVRSGILLDTHYATTEMANNTIDVNGRTYNYFAYREKGRDEVFSGMYDHAKWLLLDDIKSILSDLGWTNILIYKDEIQRNGPRVTLYAYA